MLVHQADQTRLPTLLVASLRAVPVMCCTPQHTCCNADQRKGICTCHEPIANQRKGVGICDADRRKGMCKPSADQRKGDVMTPCRSEERRGLAPIGERVQWTRISSMSFERFSSMPFEHQ